MSQLLRKNESHFEHALRLTRALKDHEYSLIRNGVGEDYLDSKIVLDILYAEITATEEDAENVLGLSTADYNDMVEYAIESVHPPAEYVGNPFDMSKEFAAPASTWKGTLGKAPDDNATTDNKTANEPDCASFIQQAIANVFAPKPEPIDPSYYF